LPPRDNSGAKLPTRLGNRIDAAAQAKLLGDIHARIPMITANEQRALQLANAKADAETWGTLADMHAGTVEGHAGLIASAERTKAAAAAEHAKAAEQAARPRTASPASSAART
jgi:hypothetical protein